MLIIYLSLSVFCFAQKISGDIVYLRNGQTVQGVILDRNVDNGVLIQLKDGSTIRLAWNIILDIKHINYLPNDQISTSYKVTTVNELTYDSYPINLSYFLSLSTVFGQDIINEQRFLSANSFGKGTSFLAGGGFKVFDYILCELQAGYSFGNNFDGFSGSLVSLIPKVGILVLPDNPHWSPFFKFGVPIAYPFVKYSGGVTINGKPGYMDADFSGGLAGGILLETGFNVQITKKYDLVFGLSYQSLKYNPSTATISTYKVNNLDHRNDLIGKTSEFTRQFIDSKFEDNAFNFSVFSFFTGLKYNF